MVTVNRTAVAATVATAFSTSALGSVVASAVASCPEPVDCKMSDFITCLKTACMNNVAGTPFIQMAKTALTAAPIPPPIAAPLTATLAKKPVAAPAVAPAAVPAASSPGAPGAAGPSSYSTGGFTYPGVGSAPISPFGGVFPTSTYASSFMALPAAFEYPGMSPALTGAA